MMGILRRFVLPAIVLCAVAAGAVPSHAADSLRYEKGYITKDTTWSGAVTIIGQTVVRRGVTLTILPGTVVKFEWIDDDGDEIGDGELTVEGRLIAKGTKDNVITFTSAQPNPKMKDWTFVQISVNKEALVEYCVFEYAFSGLQVHYSDAVIRDCLFRRNFEGVRFSTTDVRIENCDFIENYYAIRSEANGSRAHVTKNLFRNNDFAFFPVQKNGDTVKTYGNDIDESIHYNVKFGMNQKKDMDFANNWWGTADAAAIEETIWDGSREPGLGRVNFRPFLEKAPGGCGIRR
jgi:ribosomal protein S12